MKRIVFFILIFVCIAAYAHAKTLYVNNTIGNDTTTYADNSASTPWVTIGRAAWGSTSRLSPNSSQAARAGDRVLIAAGTYSAAGTNDRRTPAFNPVNSGTSGNPITFEAVGTVTLTLISSRGPVIGACEVNYITWKGFTIDEANATSAADTGPVVLWSTTGSSIENCIIDGNGNPGYGDNHNGIRLEDAFLCTIKNNRIYDVTTSGVSTQNGAGIMTYYSGGILIENNEISGCGTGVFFKANTTPTNPDGYGNRSWNTVNKNYIHDCSNGITLHRTRQTDQLQRITQNILQNNTEAIKIWSFGDAESDPNNVKVVNNTIVDSLYAFWVSKLITNPTNNIFWNNIVYKRSSTGSPVLISWAENNYNSIARANANFEHNLYFNSSNQVSGESVASLSLTTWKATHGQDSVSPAAITNDPLFVSYGSGNFKLQNSSPALTLGVDILDLDRDGSTTDRIPAGAYITGTEIIGRNMTVQPPELRIVPR
jgi:parallel beta-helix repeat protein